MDLNTIVDLISNTGFPIAACLGLVWVILKKDENYKNSIDQITKALNDNTIALTKLLERLD